MNGVTGQLATGPNGNTIFLPATGLRYEKTLQDEGTYGYYWSRTLSSLEPTDAYSLRISSTGQTSWGRRSYGYAVRPVRIPQN